MRNPSFSFPDWVGDLVPGDELFARAYADISSRNRAWMKTGIARLHDWYGPRKATRTELALHWRSGFDSRQVAEAVDFAVVLFDGSLFSPSRLLAALIPAMAVGVGNVLAVRVSNGTPWRKAILTGLELAGQELVVDMSELQARRLFGELRETSRPGAVAVLGPRAAVIKTNELQAASRISFWRPRYTRAAAIWMEGPDTFDLEALAFIHPDIVFSVFGVEPELPAENFSYEGDGFDNFLDAIMEVAYVPAARAEQTLGRARVVFGPGQEGCWIWPDLHPEHFQYQSVAWTDGE